MTTSGLKCQKWHIERTGRQHMPCGRFSSQAYCVVVEGIRPCCAVNEGICPWCAMAKGIPRYHSVAKGICHFRPVADRFQRSHLVANRIPPCTIVPSLHPITSRRCYLHPINSAWPPPGLPPSRYYKSSSRCSQLSNTRKHFRFALLRAERQRGVSEGRLTVRPKIFVLHYQFGSV